ncbi:MAG: hypothetical protein HYX24_02195 [Candidatus Aenigmarchaeota archaeon]|nr:hypothetical protein [Candidatus Aenigmarchaeota archaeon]
MVSEFPSANIRREISKIYSAEVSDYFSLPSLSLDVFEGENDITADEEETDEEWLEREWSANSFSGGSPETDSTDATDDEEISEEWLEKEWNSDTRTGDIFAEAVNLEAEQEKKAINYNYYVPLLQMAYMGVVIRRVPRWHLGYGVLGRAFPFYGLVEIAQDLYGKDFEEVKTHELMHIKYPDRPENEIRQMTKVALPFQPRWH